MTTCPHCQGEISSSATTCRYCGAKKGFKSADGAIVDRKTLKKIIFSSWVSVIVMGIAGLAFSFVLIGIPVLLMVLLNWLPKVIKMQSQLESGPLWYR